jgi:exonuclease SbcC
VAEIEAERAERVNGATRRVEAAREAHGVAEISLARAERARADAAERRVRTAAAHEKSRGALEAALASRGVDRALVEERLAKGEQFASAGAARLRSLDDRATSTRATLDERRAARERHEVSGRPPLGLEEARAAVVTAAEEARAANERRLELELALRQDDEKRDALAALLPRIDVQRERARRWAAISSVIGSGTGDRFRAFAQSLALETLLGYANQHLEQLSPRYRLMRVPGTDMELQILDRDLGDEVRSVNGLSGGETFLVSLGLALGLSALSTRAARVETLFIDEGFGTLDPDALDQAMVVLEGLRATGRTVGIISHVPELHERIGVLVKVEKTGAGRSTVRTVRLG